MSTLTHPTAPSWAATHRTLAIVLAAAAAVLLAVTLTVLMSSRTLPSPPVGDVPTSIPTEAPPAFFGNGDCRPRPAQVPDRAC